MACPLFTIYSIAPLSASWQEVGVLSSKTHTEYLAFLDQSVFTVPGAQKIVEKTLHGAPHIDILYADEYILIGNRKKPYFKPDWSPNLHLSTPYIGGFVVVRSSIFHACGGIRLDHRGYELHDLILRATEHTQTIHHIPEILTSRCVSYESQRKPDKELVSTVSEAILRRGIDGTVMPGTRSGTLRVAYQIRETPLVSIIIPTKDHYGVLKMCLESLFQKTQYPRFEILLIDNGSTDYDAVAYLSELQKEGKAYVISYPQPYNFSVMNNLAARSARGDYLIFLNDDTEIVSPEWISAMLEYAQQQDVGAAGCKLLYPDKTIQHAGVVIGMNEIGGAGISAHWLKHIPDSNEGYFGYAHLVRDVSAVTAACMMIRKELFQSIGGFDERLGVDFNDVDLCLRLREMGKKILYTPYSVLIHAEAKNRSRWNQVHAKATTIEEISYMRQKWKKALEIDPFYNRNLIPPQPRFFSKFTVLRTFAKRYGVIQTAFLLIKYLNARTRGGMRLIGSFVSNIYSKAVADRKILFITFSLSDLSVQYRISHIIEYLSSIGLRGEVIAQEHARWVHSLKNFSCIIFFRVKGGDAILERLINEAKRYGIPLVYSSDDAVFLPEHVSSFPLPKNFTEDDIRHYEQETAKRFRVFQSCDWFLASSSYLARACREREVKTVVIRNGCGRDQILYAEKIYKRKAQQKREGQSIIIGYVSGTMTHESDFATIQDTIARILSEYPIVRLRIVGHLKIPSILSERKAQVEHVRFTEWRHIADHIITFDINVAPFDLSNDYVQAKSDVKYIEAALMRVPTVAPPIQSYRETITHGVNGFLASSPEDWYARLRDLIEHGELRQKMGENAYQHVCNEYYPHRMIKETEEAFSNIIHKARPSLR